MSLEHDPAPRFTPEQRDAILDLASRLQVQHETTVGIDELMRAAEETGLESRFVQEAAMRLGRPAGPLPRSLLVVLGMFVAQAAFFVFIQNPSLPGLRSLSAFELTFAAVIAFFLGLWASHERRIRWLAPIVPLGVWFTLLLTTILYAWTNGIDQGWAGRDCAAFGLTQAVAVLLGAIFAAGVEQIDRPRGRSLTSKGL